MEIGFQGKDPSTDLRGAGMLGLRHLYYYLSKAKENSMKVYKVASDGSTWYFFCASGINFTGKIIELIENGKLDDILVNYRGEISNLTNILYDVLYTNFNSFWLKKGIKSFMDFNTKLEEFMNQEALNFINLTILTKMKIN